MLMFRVDVKQGFVLKTTRFNVSESTLSFERLYTRCTFRFKCVQSLTVRSHRRRRERASKWPEVIHFQCEPAASSGESGAARTVRASRRVEIKSALW